MIDKFILWAQALDNMSPDHFNVHGKDLESDDTLQRQAVVSKVSNVIKSGARLFEQDGVLLSVDTSHFVLEIESAQKDSVGRTAPIVCCGDYDVTVGDALGESAAAAIDDFAKKIGRTLRPKHLELVRLSFKTLKKKFAMTMLIRIAGACGVALALLVILSWLAQKA